MNYRMLNPFNRELLLFTLAMCLMSNSDLQAQARNFGQLGGNTGTTGVNQRQYNSNSMIGDARIEIDMETRSLIVVTDEETNLNIGEVIKSLDVPKPQVLIKVLFLEITHNDDSDFGIEGSVSFDGSRQSAGTAFDLATQTTGGYYKYLSDNIDVTLHTLAERGKLEILSRPSILARNNQEAIIIVGQEVPRISNVQSIGNGQTLNVIEYVDIGIILRVTPFITSDGEVEMIVAPEISTDTGETIALQPGVESPVFAKRSAETVVVTPNAKTVVIGGMMGRTSSSVVRKVPLLGDIPGIGAAFRRTIRREEKKELIIFLTPYIVKGSAALEEVSEREKASLRLAPQQFSESELNRYMDVATEPETVQEVEKEKPARSWMFRRGGRINQ